MVEFVGTSTIFDELPAVDRFCPVRIGIFVSAELMRGVLIDTDFAVNFKSQSVVQSQSVRVSGL